MFQVSGKVEEKEISEDEEKYEPNAEDIETVAAKTKASEEKAKEALIKAKGDLARAILELQE